MISRLWSSRSSRRIETTDSWFAGGSEFFIKCGSLNGFTAQTEEELKLYYPSVTDLMVNVRRKQVGKTLRFNTVLVSEAELLSWRNVSF